MTCNLADCWHLDRPGPPAPLNLNPSVFPANWRKNDQHPGRRGRKGKECTAKKQAFELVGVGIPTTKSRFTGLPVTYISAGSLLTVFVFGLHPSNVMDRDEDDCEVIENQKLAEDAIEAVKSIWQWFNQQRDEAVASYVFDVTERERREERMASGAPASGPSRTASAATINPA